MDADTVLYRQGDALCVTRLITFRCNNNCLCCIAPMEVRDKKEYTWSRLKKVLDEIPGEASTIDLNGGEPSCSTHLPKALSYLAERFPEAEVNVLTNGRAFSYTSYLASLVTTPKTRFIVALYGHEPSKHDAMTLSPGSFEQSVKGIANLINASLNVEVRVIVTRLNYRDLPSIARFVRVRFPSVRLVFINAKYTGEAFRNRKLLFIKTSRIVPYLEDALRQVKGMDVHLYHFPYCVLPKGLWRHVFGRTVPDRDICFGPACSRCTKKEKCPGIWRSYAKLAGFSEQRPI